MKLFPNTTGAKIRLAILGSLMLAIVVVGRPDQVPRYFLSDKREGDILFQSLPHGSLVDAIEVVSHSAWSHCGILVNRDGQWFVAEALGEVKYTPLFEWVVRGRGYYVDAYRVRDLSPEQAAKIQLGIAPLLGKPYDIKYEPDDKAIYCSELVYKVYERALGIKLGMWERLGDLNWQPAESFIRSMERGRLPLDREMITPVGLTKGTNIVRVFTNRGS